MKIDVRGIDTATEAYAATPKQVVVATVRAMNAALAKGQTQMKRSVADDMKIKQAHVARVIYSIKASYAEPKATLATKSLTRVPLMYFGGKGPTPSRGLPGTVSAAPRGSRKTYAEAFIARVSYYRNEDFGKTFGVHTGIFKRTVGKGSRKSAGAWGPNLPIKQLYGPSMGRVFAKYRESVVGLMARWYDEELARQLALIDPGGGSTGSTRDLSVSRYV
jgi:hypothetical protein